MTDIPNAFIGKREKPTSQEVANVLGATAPIWEQLVADLAQELDITEHEWNSYSPKYGWAMCLKRKKRNLVYFSPCTGCFRVSMIFGDRALAEIRKTKFPASINKLLDEAPRYPEGTGLVLTVRNTRNIPSIRKLAQIKAAN